MAMKGYLIDAKAREIRPIEYEYGTMNQYLPGGICVAYVFPSGDVLYVDDEGLLRPAEVAFRIKSRPDGQPMMSNGILTGRDSHETTFDPVLTPQELEREIEWMSVEDALAWFRKRASDPSVIMTTSDGTSILAHWQDLLDNLEGKIGYQP